MNTKSIVIVGHINIDLLKKPCQPTLKKNPIQAVDHIHPYDDGVDDDWADEIRLKGHSQCV